MRLEEVHIAALTPERLEPLIGPGRAERFRTIAQAARDRLAGRTVLNVNSTATGGGVAEMLRTLLAYARGAGIDAQWVVIKGDPHFFEITKRIHNNLHGAPGDGGPLGDAERRHYEEISRANADELLAVVRPRDIVLLHDPQTAGLTQALARAGVMVIWRCHIGADDPNDHTERAWSFLRPYLEEVDAYVFTRRQYTPSWADPERTVVIPPSIDPFSAKNQEMSDADVEAVLHYVGLLESDRPVPVATYTREDGSTGRIDRHVDVLQTGPPPPADAPLVVQVSRWDPLKDMAGVMTAFADYVDGSSPAHLVLAGPVVTGVADDPEGAATFERCIEVWRRLPHAERRRIHLACLPMHDTDENAIIVNAIQRHAAVVTQKSLAEGFGLTVAEAMWKAKPIVASAVGGIVDQIVPGEHGLLIDDPRDQAAFGDALRRLLDDRSYAGRLGANARARAIREFLGDRHLAQYAELFELLDNAR
ncbi:MAG TPA: glycosyltransferase [Acidimicrobiia bacterium]|nr:glycosyltransferase [Acidimicrobiia bacterium]